MEQGEGQAAAALLARLQGRWRLRREIDDRMAGETGLFEGVGEFAPGGGGLVYRERGLLHLPGRAALRAERRYVWRPDGAWVDVAFGDGRPFHRFEAGAQARARHDCAPDVYVVAYDFADLPDWSAVWEVNGPRKACTMLTRYRPG